MKCYVRVALLKVTYFAAAPRHAEEIDGEPVATSAENLYGDIGDDWKLSLDAFSLGEWQENRSVNGLSHGQTLEPGWRSPWTLKGECGAELSIPLTLQAEELEGGDSGDATDLGTAAVDVTLTCGETRTGWVHVEVREDKPARAEHRVATIGFLLKVESRCLDADSMGTLGGYSLPGSPEEETISGQPSQQSCCYRFESVRFPDVPAAAKYMSWVDRGRPTIGLGVGMTVRPFGITRVETGERHHYVFVGYGAGLGASVALPVVGAGSTVCCKPPDCPTFEDFEGPTVWWSAGAHLLAGGAVVLVEFPRVGDCRLEFALASASVGLGAAIGFFNGFSIRVD